MKLKFISYLCTIYFAVKYSHKSNSKDIKIGRASMCMSNLFTK